MGIFDNVKRKNAKHSTKNFYFGSVEAEGETKSGQSTLDYFDDYLGILNNLEQGRFIFTGRKGVGKSAIAKFIKDKSDSSKDSFATILRLNDFQIHKSIQNVERASEVMLFEWLILVQLVKLVVKSKRSTFTSEYEKLKKFLDNNSGMVSIDKYQFNEGLEKTGGEVSFGVLSHAFGGILKKYFDVKVSRAPFYKLLPALKEIVETVLSFDVNKSIEFWLLFDDLDINFDIKSKEDNERVMELIRIAKNFNNELFSKSKAKILIFLRDDIKNNIITKFPDSAKIFASYEVNINWYPHNSGSENIQPLKQLVNRRIQLNFEKYKMPFGIDPWSDLISNDNRSSFKYVLDFTFYRPRDIITFLTVVSQNEYRIPISYKDQRIILDKYIIQNIKEIKSELSIIFNDQDKENVFQKIFPHVLKNPYLTLEQLEAFVSNLTWTADPNYVISLLLDYSLLVYKNSSGELFFNYRENSSLDKKGQRMYLTLPKLVYHYYNRLT